MFTWLIRWLFAEWTPTTDVEAEKVKSARGIAEHERFHDQWENL